MENKLSRMRLIEEDLLSLRNQLAAAQVQATQDMVEREQLESQVSRWEEGCDN